MEVKRKFLVVDDNPFDLKHLANLLQGQIVTGVTSYKEAILALRKDVYDVLITDIHLSNDGQETDTPEGLLLLRDTRELYPNITAIAVSSDPNYLIFEQAFAYGALGSVRKPIYSLDELKCHLRLSAGIKAIRGFSQSLPPGLLEKYPEGLVLPPNLLQACKEIAKLDKLAVIIEGETGSGKEEIAKLIHRLKESSRGSLPFVAINCAHLSGDVSMAELFGSIRGSFTGAVDKAGLIEQANGGLLFLDEIHHLNAETQKRLLRVLNDGSYTRVGDTKNRFSEFQLIAATTQDLIHLSKEGKFLQDLFFRIDGFKLLVEPLRERNKEVFSDLVEGLLWKKKIPISAADLQSIVSRCQQHRWPGNIRELASVLERSEMMCRIKNKPLNGNNLEINDYGFEAAKQNLASYIPEELTHLWNEVENSIKGLTIVSIDELTSKFEKLVFEKIAETHPMRKDQIRVSGLPRSTFNAKVQRHGV